MSNNPDKLFDGDHGGTEEGKKERKDITIEEIEAAAEYQKRATAFISACIDGNLI